MPSTEMPALMSVDRTRQFMGGRGRGWVYERIRAGDFETVLDGGRRLVVTESVLRYIERLRADSRDAESR